MTRDAVMCVMRYTVPGYKVPIRGLRLRAQPAIGADKCAKCALNEGEPRRCPYQVVCRACFRPDQKEIYFEEIKK